MGYGMVRVRQRRALLVLPALAMLSLAIFSSVVDADIIFRVPEVLVRHTAAPKSVGITKVNGTQNHTHQEDSSLEVNYEDYYVEHEISTVDARIRAMELRIENVPESVPGCGVCTRQDMDYCQSRVLADHCCCERKYIREPFPWLPHTCYVGRERCQPLANNCVLYTRLRDCCCMRQLAAKWKGILSSSNRMSGSSASLLLLSTLLLAASL